MTATNELQWLQETLLTDRDGQLSATCARLTRIAQARGVAPHAIDDVVQETLLEAWSHLDRLYAPEGFPAWIDEICRNMCRRYARQRAVNLLRYVPSSQSNASNEQRSDEEEKDILITVVASDASDPLEELCRQDMVLLLDRTLGLLPSETRRIVEMCYLLELPRFEVAARLGISSGALETRLHRARRQLRQILSGPLHSEAEAFGLALDEDVGEGWRETRLWCPLCARQRLQGYFLRCQGREGPNLHLRCPDCSRRYQQDTMHSMGLVSLAGLSAFRPAWKRAMQGLTDLMLEALALGEHSCLFCGKAASLQVIGRDDDTAAPAGTGPYPFFINWHCPHCGEHINSNGDIPSVDQLVYWSHPLTRQFIHQHSRWSSDFGMPVEYAGQQAIRFQLADVESTNHVTVLANRETLQVLALSR